MQVIQPSKSRKIPLRPFSGMRTPDTTQPDPSGPDTIRSRICYREAPLRVESCVGNASGAGPPDQPNLGLHLKQFSLFDPADHQVDRTLHRFRYPALPWRAPDRKKQSRYGIFADADDLNLIRNPEAELDGDPAEIEHLLIVGCNDAVNFVQIPAQCLPIR